MKRVIAFALAVVFLLGAFLWFPQASYAHAAHCYADWEYCRGHAFSSDEGWVRMTLMLTVCDLAWGKCELLG